MPRPYSSRSACSSWLLRWPRCAPPAPSGGDLTGASAGRGLVTATLCSPVVLLPIYWMVATSFKTNREIRQDATLYPHAPTFDSYILLFKDKGFSNFLNQFLIVVTAASVVIAVTFGSLGAYAIARFRLRFGLERKIGLALLTLRIVPAVVILVPVYLLILQLKLIDTWAGLISGLHGLQHHFLRLDDGKLLPRDPGRSGGSRDGRWRSPG